MAGALSCKLLLLLTVLPCVAATTRAFSWFSQLKALAQLSSNDKAGELEGWGHVRQPCVLNVRSRYPDAC